MKKPRIFEVLRLIKTNNKAAPYTDKKEVVRILQQAVLNGENKNNQEKHIQNINDMLGKDRIFDWQTPVSIFAFSKQPNQLKNAWKNQSE